jgi:ferritin
MISQKVQDALNDQLNAELYSSYLYMSMSAYFQSLNLSGFANWMRVQVQEELVHATKFYDFLNERGGRVALTAIAGPPIQWNSPLDAFKAALEHEQKVTARINNLVDIASGERDHATHIFLQWFVTEQVEEEDNANSVVQKINLMGEAQGGLFMLDRELALRTFTPPAQTSGT